MKRAVNLVISVALTVLCSWWAFRDTDVGALKQSLAQAQYLWLIPFFAVLGFVHLCRTLRWQALLSGLQTVSFRAVNEASAIGFMMLIILPFRLGEFARPFLIARRSNIRRSAAMTSVVLERITDGIAVAIALQILLFLVPADAPNLGLVRTGANIMFAIFGSGLFFLLFALWQQQRAVRLVRAIFGPISGKLADVAAHVVDTFVGAMRQLPNRTQLALFFGYTVAYWLANGAGMWMLGLAFQGAGPGDGFHLSLLQTYIVMCVLVVGVMIPAAPGMVGTFQLAVKYGISLFLPELVTNSAGIAYANVLWLSQTAQQILFGVVLMASGHVSFRELTRNLSDQAADAGRPSGEVPAKSGTTPELKAG